MEKYENELFPGYEEKKSCSRKRLKRFNIVKERYLKLNEEKISIFLLVILFVVVMSYIFGYKRGINGNAKSLDDYAALEPQDSNGAVVVSTQDEVAQKSSSAIEAKENIKTSYQEYALQLVTYKSKGFAEAEKKKLENLGYPVYISERGSYKIVFVGKYKNKKKAEETLKKLKSTYRDAFLKTFQGGG